ncbi:tetratricopeptide repeat protein [Paenirhodobacter populi]|uniref:tetratricopeptide repeat protein n=1 Tax=Paenirhodobacter populi TaxID=2306993 RepID=UPI0013E36F4C|nr:tetratricopeptide repeat protein [Sinirhodobacter populi]
MTTTKRTTRKKRKGGKIVLAIIVCLVVAGGVVFATLGSKEERATKYYASAQDLVAKGDASRALIELRNALQMNPELHEARVLFADLLMKAGRRADAFGQYRQLYIQDPQNMTAARTMAMIAFESMAWDDARQYAQAVLDKIPDDPMAQAILAGIDYREGVRNKDEAAITKAIETERNVLTAHPDLVQARRVLIADGLRVNDLETALKLTDEGLVMLPADRDLNNARVVLLERMNNLPELEKQLLSMVALYPKDEEVGRSLVRFYVSQKRLEDAEQILRDKIDPNGTDPEPRMVLLRFLSEVRSPAAMRDELQQVLSQDPLPKDVAHDPVEFRALKAQADYLLGQRDQGMADLENMIKGMEPSDETDRLKVSLAQMRLGTGNTVGARSLVEEVLARDPGQIQAMKMKASWLTDEDQTEPAIALLRDALADAPDDAQILTLLARAYQREGRPELMADMMARAVDASQQAAPESLTYATYLAQQGQYVSAETILINALRRQPQNLQLLSSLARIHLAMKDWSRAQQDIDTIEQRFPGEQGQAQVRDLRAQLLVGQGRTDELSGFLDQLAQDPNNALAVRMASIRNSIRTGNLDRAATEAQQLAQENPDSPDVALVQAQLKFAQGQDGDGEAALQALVQAHPDYVPGWMTLQAVQLRSGDFGGALQTVDAALEKLPGNRGLQLSKAFALEKVGRIDDAIALYEQMYAANSEDVAVANNLASLLSSTRDDQASLDRAWTVARRLNGSQIPAFQDTYGWLAFRRGEVGTALPLLEQAARGLTGDPSVAYHLGRAYAAQRRFDEAKAEYDRADALLEKGNSGYPSLPDDLQKARSELP